MGRADSGGGDLQAAALHWPTPTSLSFKDSHQPGNSASMNRTLALAADLRASAWPTPSARDFKGAPDERWGENSRPLNEVAKLWNTPRASDGEKGGPNQSLGAGGVPLPAQTAQWSTPSVADTEGGRKARSGARSNELLLNGQAADLAAYVTKNAWPTPTALSRPRSPETTEKCRATRKAKAGQNTVPLYLEEVTIALSSRQDLETPTLGAPSSGAGRKLNPLFVEWLMGWPPGWTLLCSTGSTACGFWGTELSAWKARMRSELSQLVSPPAPPAQLALFG